MCTGHDAFTGAGAREIGRVLVVFRIVTLSTRRRVDGRQAAPDLRVWRWDDAVVSNRATVSGSALLARPSASMPPTSGLFLAARDGDGGSLPGGNAQGPEGEDEDMDEDEDEDGDGDDAVVEVTEEELMDDWIARGLDAAAFDPQRLLEMWTMEEDAEQASKFLEPIVDAAAAKTGWVPLGAGTPLLGTMKK